MHDALDILHHHNGVVDQKADHQHQREQGQCVDGIMRHRQDAEGAQQHHRHRDRRNQRGAPVLQEDIHDQYHQGDGFQQGHHHVMDGQPDEQGVVDGVDDLHAGWQRGLQFIGLGLDRIHRLERIGARRQHDRKTGGGIAVVKAGDGIGLRAQLDARDIAQPDHGAAGRGLEDDVAELFRRLQPRLRGDGGIDGGARRGGLLADLARRDLDILGADGTGDVGWLQGEIVQLVRVEPDAHGILRAEHPRIAHAGHPRDRVLHLGGDEVGNVDIGVASGIVIDTDHDDEVGRVLGHHHAQLLHRAGQQRHSCLHLVLHLHLGDVGIGARGKGGGDLHRAVGIGRGREVKQIVQAGELLLDHLGDGVLQGFRVRAGIGGADHHGGRRDGGILLDRQAESGNAAGQHDDHGDDPGKNRAVDEKA